MDENSNSKVLTNGGYNSTISNNRKLSRDCGAVGTISNGNAKSRVGTASNLNNSRARRGASNVMGSSAKKKAKKSEILNNFQKNNYVNNNSNKNTDFLSITRTDQ